MKKTLVSMIVILSLSMSAPVEADSSGGGTGDSSWSFGEMSAGISCGGSVVSDC